MSATHEALVRQLEAERARPDTKPPTTQQLMDELIGALSGLFRRPRDTRRAK